MRLKHILCAVDFSESSRHALDHALAMARWYSGRVTAVHVVQPMSVPGHALGPHRYEPLLVMADDLETYRQQANRFVGAESGDIPVDVAIVAGNPADEVIIQAGVLRADVIVVGSHGRSGFERLRLGSVAEHVLRKAPCPVLVVPHRAPDAVPAGPIIYRHIVCGVDFSPASDEALEYAVALARPDGARVTAVHAVELARILQPTVVAGPDTLSYHARLRADARERLRRLLTSRTPTDFYVGQVLADGKADQVILQFARDQQADLIVLGVHSSVVGAMTLGSTTNHVLRQAACPVLTVRGVKSRDQDAARAR